MTHPIRRYIEAREISQAEFGRRAGLSPQYICDMLAGRALCGKGAALAIVEATGGEISLAELLTYKPEEATV